MRRIIAVLVVATGVVMLVSSDALARGDGWEAAPAAPFTIPSSVCGFPVDATFPINQEFAKTVSQTDTTLVLRITGNLVQALTNADTGKSITVNISGPATLVIDLQTGVMNIYGQGRASVFFLPQDQAEFGVPGIMLVSGHVHETLDPSTNDVSALSVSGVIRDGCAQLA